MHGLSTTDHNSPAPNRLAGATLMAELSQERRTRVADVIEGSSDEIELDELMLAVEVDAPRMRWDHVRLLRAASLAIQYYRENPMGHSERAFLRQFAAAVQVDADELSAYALVLQREIRHREKTGSSSLTDLPRLIKQQSSECEEFAEALLALPSPTARFKHDPSEYVELAEQGLNNTEIAKHLGDVSEASVRRGLASVGYKRPSTAIDEAGE